MIIFRNEIEAKLIASILDEKKIPYILNSYHDSAYDGLFQSQKGWGHLEALDIHKNLIIDIYNDLIKKIEKNQK